MPDTSADHHTLRGRDPALRKRTTAQRATLLLLTTLALSPRPSSPQLSTPSRSATQPTRPATDLVPRTTALPFAPGESLTYKVSWSGILTAGTATLRVIDRRPAKDGHAHYYVVAEAQSGGWVSAFHRLFYKLETLVDTTTLLPTHASIYSEEGRHRRTKTTAFDRTHGTATYELRTATIVTRQMDIPAGCYDALSVLYALRAAALETGAHLRAPVADSGRIYDVDFHVLRRELVRLDDTRVFAWRIVPTIRQASGRPEASGIVLWIADDGRRVPVKITVDLTLGDFVFSLAGDT